MIQEILASNLNRLRVSNALSKCELARIAGINRKAIIYIEQGIYNPTLYMLEDIAAALGVSIIDLLKEGDINGTD